MQIGDYDMDNIILDLGLDINIPPTQTWEMMGRPKFTQSPIQLRLETQYKFFLIGRVTGVEVNINRVRSIVDFEFIDIMDGTNPYPTLLGIDQAFDNKVIINLKKRPMFFELGDLKVTVPLDPIKRSICGTYEGWNQHKIS